MPARLGTFLALLAVGLLLLAGGATAIAPAVAAAETEQVTITYFYGDGCPYCAAEEEFLAELIARHPGISVNAYEVWYNEANRRLYVQVAAAHGIEAQAVPATFLAGYAWIGFSPSIGREIEAVALAELARLAPSPSPSPSPSPTASAEPAASAEPDPSPSPSPATIDIPLIGSVGLGGQSLLVTTGLIAFVDGFNPCSLWVLSVLLAMMLHSGSRRRLLVVGLTFLLVTAAAYGAFMLGLLSVIGLIGHLWWVQVAIAAIVLVFAVLAIKDYFWLGRGVSLSIPERHKPAIYGGSRNLLSPDRPLLAVVAATVVLAAGVALIELPCTAGLPLLWSGIVAERAVAALEYGLLLGVYLAIYLLDELLVFGTVLVTMRASRMQERHGRALKLVAGSVMFALAAAMLFAPATLNTIGGTVVVFGSALVIALAILLAHRRLLPRFGIRLGNEI